MAYLAYQENDLVYLRKIRYGEEIKFIGKILIDNFNQSDIIKIIFSEKKAIYSLAYDQEKLSKLKNNPFFNDTAFSKVLKTTIEKEINNRIVLFDKNINDITINLNQAKQESKKEIIYLFDNDKWLLLNKKEIYDLPLLIEFDYFLTAYINHDLTIDFFNDLANDEKERIKKIVNLFEDKQNKKQLQKFFINYYPKIESMLKIPMALIENTLIDQQLTNTYKNNQLKI